MTASPTARYDVPQLITMIRQMSLQGCSADAALDAEVDSEVAQTGSGFGAADGTGHFSVELGSCDFESLQAKVDTVDRACCRAEDTDDQCTSSGVPSQCDLECAIHYVPFHEDCNALLAGTFAANMDAFNTLYGQCMANSRRDVSGLLRTMYLTNDQVPPRPCSCNPYGESLLQL